MKWEDDVLRETNGDSNSGDNDDSFLPDPSHQLQGTLEIGGDYLVVILRVSCRWKAVIESQSGASSSSTQYGKIFFSCHAKARFRTKSELREKDNENGGTDRADRKVQDKIRSKVLARLRDDAYICKLFVEKNDSSSQELFSVKEDATHSRGPLLAEAKIKYSALDLEERVAVVEDVCEAIKRAVWSSAESPLDVVEIILQMPFLPTTEHKSEATTIAVTQLANRAKLRLLEDAMCDACEKEGDGEMLDDLKISEGATNPSDVQEGGDDEESSWKNGPSKKKKDSKRTRKKAKSD